MSGPDRTLFPRIGSGYDSRLTDYQAQANTGSTTENQVGQNFVIPGRAMNKNGEFEVELAGTCTNNANVKTLRGYFGGVQVFSVALTSGAVYRLLVSVSNRNDMQAQVVTVSGFAGGAAVLQVNTVAVNTFVDQIFKITAQLATGTDTVQQEAIDICLESSDQ